MLAVADAVTDHLAGCAVERVADVLVVERRDDRPVRRHRADAGAERLLHVIEVAVDVGVVEFDGAEQQRLCVVVPELRRLVEEGGVVLVAFDYEVRSAALAERPVEVERDAADQHRRIAPGRDQQRAQQARRRRLAVGSRDDHRVMVRHRQLVERVGKRAIGDARLEDRLRLGIVGTHRVADHHEIRTRREHVLRVEAERDGDLPALERVAHRRVERPIRSGDAEPTRVQQAGERAHAGAADRDEMHVLELGRERRHGARSSMRRTSQP